MNVIFLGLSITSSWGNGHATTYRGLVRELVRRGHDVLFLERDVPWYAENRDLARPPYGRTELYGSLEELESRFGREIAAADLVVVGSFVPEGVAVGRWVQRRATGLAAFYDIDTPLTLAKLRRGDYEYLSPELIPGYALYLSFTGGPALEYIERHYGAPRARVLYCSVSPDDYRPVEVDIRWELGYLGTYSEDRQAALECLLLEPARRLSSRRFVAAGPLYPESIAWPANVDRIHHLPPSGHPGFYCAQRLTLNITRADMKQAGYSPSVRLFEAAACGTPIVSDYWDGIEEIFQPGRDIFIASSQTDIVRLLTETPPEALQEAGRRARQRILEKHTSANRAEELEGYYREAVARARRAS